MALIVPYESREGIWNAGHPGPVARQRSADEFLSQGDKALAPALQNLSQGLGQLGGVIHEKEVRENWEKLQLDLTNDLLAESDAHAEFLDNYKRDYQGADAFNAEQDFMAWNKPRAEALSKKYAGNAWARQQLAQKFGGLIIDGRDKSRDYRNAQLNVYREQTALGLQARHLAQIAADPGNWRVYSDRMYGDFADFNGGAAPEFAAAKRDEITKLGQTSAFNAAVSAGNMDLARTIMSEAYAAGPSAGSAGGWLTGGAAGGLGGLSARYESAKSGSRAIGWDSKGGTSYGTYQIASKTGTFDVFVNWLKKNGHQKAAQELAAAGPANTGGRSGAMVDTWKKLVAEGAITHDLEHDFIKTTHYDPAMQKIESGSLRQLIAGSKALQDVAWSTAVQHGAAGGAGILNAAYKEGMTADQFINSVYGRRTSSFRNNPYVAGATRRFQSERNDALAMSKQEGQEPAVSAQASHEHQPLDPSLSTGEPVLVASLGGGVPAGAFQADDAPAVADGEPVESEDVNNGRPAGEKEPAGLPYGGLFSQSELQNMWKVFDKAEEGRIKALNKAAIDQMGQADLSGALTREMVLSAPHLSRDEKLRWLDVADGKAGFQGHVKGHQKETLEDILYVARQAGDINSKADLDHFYASPGVSALFGREDYERHLKEVESGDKALNDIINQFLIMNPDSFSGKDARVKADQELFKVSAMKLIRQRRLTARNDSDKIQDFLTDWLSDDRYKKSDGVDRLPGAYADKPGTMETLIRERIQRGGHVDTPFNQARAREAIEKSVPMREIMAPDAESWDGKGLMTLFDADRSFPTIWLANKVADFFTRSSSLRIHKELFEEAGNSYNVDPNLLAALGYVASGGDRYAASALKPGAVGLMQLNPETGAGLGAADLADPRQSIFAAANALDQLLTFYEGNTRAALAAYAGLVEEKETTDFINEVLRVYNKNYGLAEMGPRVDPRHAPSRYTRPGDRN